MVVKTFNCCKSLGSMICFGDTGAGLVFRHNDGRHYLIGIMVRSPDSPTEINACSRQKLGVYTNTYFYIWNFILQKEAEFRPDSNKT